MAAIDVRVPDIGDFRDIPVIEVLVAPGQRIDKDAPLVTLESDKATMEVPSPHAGTVRDIAAKVGDKVSEGSALLTLDADEVEARIEGGREPPSPAEGAGRESGSEPRAARAPPPGAQPQPQPCDAHPGMAEQHRSATHPAAHAAGPESHPIARPDHDDSAPKPHASPGVRKYARELGVDLAHVPGSGPKARIVVDDVQAFVRAALGGGPTGTAPRASVGLGGGWLVRHEGEADITDLEAFRASGAAGRDKNSQPPLIAFVVKAAALAFAASRTSAPAAPRDSGKASATIAVSAANGGHANAVTVIRAADLDGIADIAAALSAAEPGATSAPPAASESIALMVRSVARLDATAPPPAMTSGAVVVDVAPAAMRAVWDGERFAPRAMLPLAVWSEPRALDVAAASSFLARLVALLGDLRRAIL